MTNIENRKNLNFLVGRPILSNLHNNKSILYIIFNMQLDQEEIKLDHEVVEKK